MSFLGKVIEEFNALIEDLKVLSKAYEKILSNETDLPQDFFSTEDKRKLTSLKDHFIALLKKFNYQSKPFEAIRISQDSYLPVATENSRRAIVL